MYGICLWKNEYLLAGFRDKTIKIIDLNKGIIIKNLKGHKEAIYTIKKIEHPIYGECLISQGWAGDGIKLWKNNI